MGKIYIMPKNNAFVLLEDPWDQRIRSYCNYLKCVQIMLFINQVWFLPFPNLDNDHMVDIPSYLCKPLICYYYHKETTKIQSTYQSFLIVLLFNGNGLSFEWVNQRLLFF